MSSAAVGRGVSRAGLVGAGVAWTALAIVVALGSAGLVGQLLHPPGGANRQELTYTNDQALQARLNAAASSLNDISQNVDRMSDAAKAALGSITDVDPAGLQTNLEKGDGAAVLIASASTEMENSLAGLPGDGPDATVDYSNAVLVRRAAILSAMDASLSLADDWRTVTSESLSAARAAKLLNDHEATIFQATQLGTQSQYQQAIDMIETAKVTIEDIASLRNLITAGSDINVLDAWIVTHSAYDAALENLYQALLKSNGVYNLAAQAAARAEESARANLPADNRAIIVIVAQLAQGGLNQAVLAINEAQGRIDSALAETGVP
ncbi:MAG TPA: hypothetical protein VKR30_10810 [Candidatus Limnocylindrales bacterium]|nr:hypothetical protein [Candidatus Limnocylindrales bacterium]